MPRLSDSALSEIRIEAVADIAEAAMGRPVGGARWALTARALVDEAMLARDREATLRAERDAQWAEAKELRAALSELVRLSHAISIEHTGTVPCPECDFDKALAKAETLLGQ